MGAPLSYREVAPPPDLAAGLSCIWFMRDASARGPGRRERILPDGCVEIVYSLADGFRHHPPGAAVLDQPSRLFVGPTTRAMLIEPRGAIDLVGVRLRPGGASALVPFDLVEATDASGGVDDFGGLLPADLRERLGDSDDDGRRLGHVLGVARELASGRERRPRRASVCAHRANGWRGAHR